MPANERRVLVHPDAAGGNHVRGLIRPAICNMRYVISHITYRTETAELIRQRRRITMIRKSLSRFAIAVIAALPILIQPAPQHAQQPAQQQDSQPKQKEKQPDAQPQDRAEQEPSVRISTQLVQIDLTVTDKKG